MEPKSELEKWSIRFKDKKDKEYFFVIYHNLHHFGIKILDLFCEWDKKRNSYNINDFVLYCKMSCAGSYVFPEGGVSDLERSLREQIEKLR